MKDELDNILKIYNFEATGDYGAAEPAARQEAKLAIQQETVKAIKEVLDRLEERIKDTLTPEDKYLYILGDRYDVYSKVEREYDRYDDDTVTQDWDNVELRELLGILLSEHIDDIEAERKKL